MQTYAIEEGKFLLGAPRRGAPKVQISKFRVGVWGAARPNLVGNTEFPQDFNPAWRSAAYVEANLSNLHTGSESDIFYTPTQSERLMFKCRVPEDVTYFRFDAALVYIKSGNSEAPLLISYYPVSGKRNPKLSTSITKTGMAYYLWFELRLFGVNELFDFSNITAETPAFPTKTYAEMQRAEHHAESQFLIKDHPNLPIGNYNLGYEAANEIFALPAGQIPLTASEYLLPIGGNYRALADDANIPNDYRFVYNADNSIKRDRKNRRLIERNPNV